MTYQPRISVLFTLCLLFPAIPTSAQSLSLVKPLTATDINPDPDVIEVELVAREDTISFGTENMKEVYAYNGSIPGPTIEGKVGDTLIVHFTNLLPEATTIHWHGMELPANMDGSNISQHPILAGGTFRYEFKFLRASTFWYHPHIRTNEQVEKGLYGMIVVRDPDEDLRLGLPERAHQLVLDDVLLDKNGQITEPFPADPLENAVMQVNGREGNTLLVNGQANAVGTVERGVPQRLRLVNTANARFMRISIAGHRMFRIGGDGGLLESPIEIQPIGLVPDPDDPTQLISDPDPNKGLVLTSGDRADVVFTPSGDGPTLAIEWHDIGREGEVEAFGKEPGDDTSGGWVFHCHILEHADRGMMSFLQVKNFQINAGLNDAWVNADAPFQGMFVTVLPVLKLVFLSWFTFDSEQPPENVTAVFGAPDQRWVTALGSYDGNRVEMSAELTTGGMFNSSDPLPVQDTQYGTINLEFINCEKGNVEYNFPTASETGSFNIHRVLSSNVALCEALNSD